jgi:hypothetical protein
VNFEFSKFSFYSLNHLLLRLISTLLKLEISTLLKTITNSCFQALQGLKFQALEGLKFQDKQTQKQMIQTKELFWHFWVYFGINFKLLSGKNTQKVNKQNIRDL